MNTFSKMWGIKTPAEAKADRLNGLQGGDKKNLRSGRPGSLWLDMIYMETGERT